LTRYTLIFVYLISAINGQEFQYKYFGESPPGNTPKIFAEKIIAHAGTYHIVVAFHPNEKEIYWLPVNPLPGGSSEILYSVYENKKWSEAKIFEPSRGNNVLFLSISPDGKKLYFSSNKIWPNGWGKQPPPRQLGHFKIWYCEREQDSWSKGRLLEKNINDIGGVSESIDHTLYTDGLKKSEMSNGLYQAWEQVDTNLDVGRSSGGHPFISPDESFVLFGKRRETFGSDCKSFEHLAQL